MRELVSCSLLIFSTIYSHLVLLSPAHAIQQLLTVESHTAYLGQHLVVDGRGNDRVGLLCVGDECV